MVRGRLPGLANIEAFYGDVVARVTVQVNPGRIEIQPEALDLQVGQQVNLTARALDADGAPIPGVRFLWYSGVSSIANVDGGGAVTGLTEGAVTVSAALDIPDAAIGLIAEARVRVRRRADFRVARVISSDYETRPVTLKKVEQISYAGGDRVAMVGSLSNGSQAVLLLEGGALRTLAVSGQYLDAAALTIGGFGAISLSSAGDLVAITYPAGWCGNCSRLMLYRGGKWEQAGDQSEFCCLWSSPRSLGEQGEAAFYAWSNPDQKQKLIFRRQDGRLDRIAAQNDQLPGFGTIQGFNNTTVFAPGKFVVGVNGPNGNGYYQWDGSVLRKLIVTGDAVLGQTVRWMWPPVGTASGDLYFVVGFDGSQQLLRLSGGTWSLVVQAGLALASGPTVHYFNNLFDVRGAAVLFAGSSDRGDGLFRLENGNLEIVARYGSSSQNDEWRWFDTGFLQTAGSVLAKGVQGSQISRTARLDSGSSTTLVDVGQSLDVAAGTGVDWGSLGGGGAGSDVVFRSYSGALMRVGRNSLQPALSLGDPMPPSGSLLTSIGGPWASNSRGDVAFRGGTTQGWGLYLWRNGKISQLAPEWGDIKCPGGWNPQYFGWPMAVNNNSQVAVWTGCEGHNALLLFTDGSKTAQSVMAPGTPAPGGGLFNGPNSAAIDDRGRVAFTAGTAGRPAALFLWDSGNIQKLRQIGDPGPNNIALVNFEGPVRAAGDKLYAELRYGNWGSPVVLQIVDLDGAGGRTLVSRTDWLAGQYSVNSSGDVAYAANLADGGTGLFLHKRDGRDVLVASTSQRTSEGDWFTGQLFSWYLNEQGEVFFTAMSPTATKDRITLFLATPQ